MKNYILLVLIFIISGAAQISYGVATEQISPDNEKEIEQLRKELANETNNPDNIVNEYRLAVLIRQRTDPKTHQYIVTDETRQIYERIVNKYNHMDYYSTELPNHPRSEQIIVPECATVAGFYQKDQEKARQYYLKALECLNQTCLQRKKDWRTAPTPKKPPEDSPLGGPIEVAKWESRMSMWQKKKQDAERGNVLHEIELGIIKRAVKSYLLIKLPVRVW
jgi:hypothetical protein